jgi:hypothetical protein
MNASLGMTKELMNMINAKISTTVYPLPAKSFDRGIFMFTLDTEIAWGMKGDKNWQKEFENTRQVVDGLLKLLDKYQISATWAFVGELMREGDDRLYHAPEMLKSVMDCSTPQEIGCHSFSHPVMDDAAFMADDMDKELSSCVETAKSVGVELKSFVFPQNKIAHIDRLSRFGFVCYRGKDKSWYAKFPKFLNKLAHVVDEYLLIAPPTGTPVRRGEVLEIPGGYFYPHKRGWAKLLPVSFRVRKAVKGLRKASDKRQIFHLWTHPFNLASDPKELLHGLETIFKEVAQMREKGQIEVRTMKQI